MEWLSGPEKTRYSIDKDSGGSVVYIVELPNGRTMNAYPKAGDIDALINDILHPPELPEPPPPEPDPRDVKIAALERAVAALKTADVLTDAMIDAERSDVPVKPR